MNNFVAELNFSTGTCQQLWSFYFDGNVECRRMITAQIVPNDGKTFLILKVQKEKNRENAIRVFTDFVWQQFESF